MKILLAVVLAVFCAAQSSALTKNTDTILLSEFHSHVNEARVLIERFGREKIAEEYFDQLREDHVMLSQMKADPNLNKSSINSIIELSFAIGELIGSDSIATPVSDLQPFNKGSSTSVIRGIVRDFLTGEVLPGNPVQLYDHTGFFVASVTTDDQGRYIFNGLMAGDYAVMALAPYYSSYITTIYPQQDCPGGLGSGCFIDELSLLTLGMDEIIDDVDMMISVKPTVMGSVYNDTGNVPLSFARIRLYDSDSQHLSSVLTNNNGLFKISAPQEGSYYVQVEKSGYQSQLYDGYVCQRVCDFTQAQTIQMTTNTVTEGIDFVMKEYAGMSGSIFDAATLNDINVSRVYVYNQQGYFVYTGYLNGNNQWKVNHLRNDEYYVVAESEEYLAAMHHDHSCQSSEVESCDISMGTIVEHYANETTDVDVLLSKGASIEGVVTNIDGQFINDVEIGIYNNNQVLISRLTGTDANGLYITGALSNGEYYVVAEKYGYEKVIYPNTVCQNSVCDFDLASTVSIENGQGIEGLNFQLNELAKVSGVISDDNGMPISHAYVVLRDELSNFAYGQYAEYNGEFRFFAIPQGSYQIYVNKDNYYPETHDNIRCFNEQCSDVGYTPLVINLNEERHVDFNLTRYGQVTFNFISNSMNPINDGTVRIFNADGSFYGNSHYSREMYLPQGSYYFYYETATGSYDYHFVSKVYGGNNCFDNCDASSGTLVSVVDGTQVNLSMDLDEYFYLTINSSVNRNNYFIYNDDSSLYLQGSIYGNSINRLYIKDAANKKIKLTSSNHLSQLYAGINCSDDLCDLSQATSIEPQINQSLTVDFDLQAMTSVSGRVTNEQGEPLENFRVSLLENINGHSNYRAETAVNGEYTISGIPEGQYIIKVEQNYPYDESYAVTYYGNIACEFSCSEITLPTIEITSGDHLTDKDVNVKKRGSISGEGILGSDGQVVDAQIELYRLDGDSLIHARSISVDDFGNIPENYLISGDYKLVARTQQFPIVYSSYPSGFCEEGGIICAEKSETLSVNFGEQIHFDGFVVRQLGKIQGEIASDIPSVTVEQGRVRFYPMGQGLNYQSSNVNNGIYSARLPAGLYYVYFEGYSGYSYEFFDQLYNGINCIYGLGIDCLLSQGLLVEVNNDGLTTVDFNVKSKPRLSVNFKDQVSQKSIPSTIKVYDSSGDFVIGSGSNSGPEHIFILRNPGEYYILGSAGLSYDNIGYPGVPCENIDSIASCIDEELQPIVVTLDSGLININLNGLLKQGVSGYIKKDNDEEALADIIVDFWDDGGLHLGSTTTSGNGGFSYELSAGDYFISTDTGNEYMNEVYDNIFCESAAILGICDVTQGLLMNVPDNNVNPILINIGLSIDPIFAGSFE